MKSRLSKKMGVSVVSLLTVGGLVVISCGKKKEEEKDPGVQATNVAELKMSSSLNITLPTALAKAGGQQASTYLSSKLLGKKSSQACRTIQNISSMFDNLRSISGMFCHLEAESAQFKFGTKYKVVLQMGSDSEEMPLWIDNSTAGQLTMYTCSSGKVREKIILNSSNSNGAKGSIVFKGSEGSKNFANALSFDFTTAGVKMLSGQNTFSEGSDSYVQDNVVELRDSGVSLMRSASKGSSSSYGSFQDRGAVRHNGTSGQALFKGTGTHSGNAYDFSVRSTFDQNGITVANSSASSDITVAASELPSFLADGFTIADPTGWDCSTDQTITIDMINGPTAQAHKACDRENPQFSDCYGDDFEQGEFEQIN